MRHFFILGTQPALSTAELLSVLPPEAVIGACSRTALVAETPDSFNSVEAMKRLGGTVKVGVIMEDVAKLSEDELIEKLADWLEQSGAKRPVFGLSVYRLVDGARLGAAGDRKLGMAVKGRLKERGMSSRWVKAQEGTTLTSVVVEKNHLINEGAEFVLLADRDAIWLARTEAVQPFEEFSRADYGRPDRDTRQGMLPPKLARLMINVSGASRRSPILDPFCGSGTVVTEALRLGYPSAFGSDINPAAVEATRKNFEWYTQHQMIPSGAKLEAFVTDARNLGNRLDQDSIGAIVAETYLGQPRRGRETRGDLQKQLEELSRLYHESLGAWRRVLKTGSPVVLAIPVYIYGKEKHGADLSGAAKLGFTIEPLLTPALAACFPDSQGRNRGLVYGRPEQLVWREIVRLRLTK